MFPYIYIGSFSIPSYGICMAMGIIVACIVAYVRLKDSDGTIDSLLLVAAVALAFGLCCAKVSYYVFSYGIDTLITEIIHGDFSGLTNDGLVYYGGLIGGIIGACIAIKSAKYDFHDYANAIIPCIPLGHAFGRIGCLLAGCCYGLRYNGVLAIHSTYVDASYTLFPIQAVESFLNVIIFALLTLFTIKKRNGMVTLSVYLILYSLVRFITEFFRGDLVRGVFWSLSTSQWISLLLMLFSTVALVKYQINNSLRVHEFR